MKDAGNRTNLAMGISAAAGLCLCWSAAAQLAEKPALQTLDLKIGQVDTSLAPDARQAAAPFVHGRRYILQIDGPLTSDRAQTLSSVGVKLGQYLPQHAYITTLDGVRPESLTALEFVMWVGEFDTSWKLDPELGKRPPLTPERAALAATGRSRVAIVLFDDAAADEATAAVAGCGGIVNDSGRVDAHWILDATLPSGRARDLASLASVQFIEDAPEAIKRNDSNRWILQSNVSGQTPIWNQGIHGEGQIGGLIDGTVKESHCMFDDTVAAGPTHRKIVAMHAAGAVDTHGTHTAGTMLGDAPPYGSYTGNDGMAYAAKLSFTNLDFISSANLQSSLQAAHTDGARVHSNSWGNDATTSYTSHCQAIDAFSYANEDDLVCFAVSNGTTVKTPENAVNVLAVSASQDAPGQGSPCIGGIGPTADGRRKPEILAPGCGTISADAGTACGVTAETGTSMACPAIAGAALLARQYYTDGFYPSGIAVPEDARTPSGALLKATLINAAVDMTGVTGYPSNGEGWGRLLLDNGLYFSGDARKLVIADVRNVSGLTTSQTVSFPLNVLSAGQPLKIVLAFTSPAAAVNAANPVINNLDLELIGPGGTYKGNVFTGGQSAPGGTADAKNNVEVVLLSAPPAGAYTVTIKATAVNQGKQGYAMVATGDLGPACVLASIASQPLNQSVALGDPALFYVTATGTAPITYHWRRNGIELFDNIRITGSSTSNLLISPVQMSDGGVYDVVVSNGCGVQTSSGATLLVLCYANCDNSTTPPILNIFDYVCFLNRFSAGNSAANCDASTTVPLLTVSDFTCFLNRFAAGCQ